MDDIPSDLEFDEQHNGDNLNTVTVHDFPIECEDLCNEVNSKVEVLSFIPSQGLESMHGNLGGPFGFAYATIVGNGKPPLANTLVIHHWGSNFVDLVAAVLADALNEQEYSSFADMIHERRFDEIRDLVAGKLDETYWLSPFALNQHQTFCACVPDENNAPQIPSCYCCVEKRLEGPLCEARKVQDVFIYLKRANMKLGRETQSRHRLSVFAACDYEFNLMDRLWCLKEIAIAEANKVAFNLVIHSMRSLQRNGHAKIEEIQVESAGASYDGDRTFLVDSIVNTSSFNDKVREMLLFELTEFEGHGLRISQAPRGSGF